LREQEFRWINRPTFWMSERRFMEEALLRIASPDIDAKWALSILDLPRDRLRRPGEYLRFETLMGSLSQNEIDPDLHVLDCLDQCEHPNFNHYLLAGMLRSGMLVMTTNFDRLIYGTLVRSGSGTRARGGRVQRK
jgi:hypothetical protein